MKDVMVVRESDGLVVNVVVIDDGSNYPVPSGYILADYEAYEMEVVVDDKKEIVKMYPEQGMYIDIVNKRVKGRVGYDVVLREFVTFLQKQHEMLGVDGET